MRLGICMLQARHEACGTGPACCKRNVKHADASDRHLELATDAEEVSAITRGKKGRSHKKPERHKKSGLFLFSCGSFPFQLKSWSPGIPEDAMYPRRLVSVNNISPIAVPAATRVDTAMQLNV